MNKNARGTFLGDASVVVLDLADWSRGPVSPRGAVPRRKIHIRPAPLLGIVVAHAAVIALAVAVPGERIRFAETEPLIITLERPAVLMTDEPAIALTAHHRYRHSANAISTLPAQDADLPVIMTIGVGTMAPHPAEYAIDQTPFARRAGLQAGQGATVVLRVEVLGSGDVGRVELDVSGGTAEIDSAAVAYAHALPWVGGMIDGLPATMWIRLGVRLEGLNLQDAHSENIARRH